MNKVPVGGSIAHAYEFLFGRFFQIIGTAWLPALLYGLGSYVLLLNMPVWMPMPLHGRDAATIATAVCVSLASLVFALVIRSVIGISLTQEALGVRKDLTLAHFVLGPRELRLFFAQIRYYLLFFVLYALALAICVGALVAARKYGAGLAPNLALNGKPIAVLAATVFAVVVLVWFGLSMLRLAFLLTPIASVEHRVRLARGWALTRGSGWRILIVCVVALLPVAIAAGIAAYFLLGPNDMMNLMAQFRNAKPGSPPPLAQFYAAHARMLAAFGTVLTIVNGALFAGASAAAYRAVTGHEDPEPEDDAALVAPLIAAPLVAEQFEEPLPAVPDLSHSGGHDDHDRGGQEDAGHGNGHGHDAAGGHGHDAAHGPDDGHGHDASHGQGDGHGHDGHGHDHKNHDDPGHDDHGDGDHHAHAA